MSSFAIVIIAALGPAFFFAACRAAEWWGRRLIHGDGHVLAVWILTMAMVVVSGILEFLTMI